MKHIPIYPVKGYAIRLPYVEGMDDSKGPQVNIVDDANKLYVSPLKGGVRVSGIAEIAGYNTEVDPARARFLLDRALSWLPGLVDGEKAVFHSCCRPLSPDDVPIIGAVHPFSNLYINGGHGSKGWTLCFGSSCMLSQIIAKNDDAPDIDITPYDPQRFIPVWKRAL